MDITFLSDNQKFNYRVCAVIISDGRILAMRDGRSPYYYLPGGRVRMGERAEDAVIRELKEELGISAVVSRPLWMNQAFFTEDVTGNAFHEICIYFLVDISGTKLESKGDRFTMKEGEKTLSFEWLEFERLEDEYFYPLFIKKEIFNLPEEFTLRTEIQ